MVKPSPEYVKNIINEAFCNHQVKWLGAYKEGYAIEFDKFSRLMQVGKELGEHEVCEQLLEDFSEVIIVEDQQCIAIFDADLFFDIDKVLEKQNG